MRATETPVPRPPLFHISGMPRASLAPFPRAATRQGLRPARVLFLHDNSLADRLRVVEDRGQRQALNVVGVVGARRDPSLAVLGAVTRAAFAGAAREVANVGARRRSDAAGDLDQRRAAARDG